MTSKGIAHGMPSFSARSRSHSLVLGARGISRGGVMGTSFTSGGSSKDLCAGSVDGRSRSFTGPAKTLSSFFLFFMIVHALGGTFDQSRIA